MVLIESTQPARAPLPVLSRGPVDSVGRDRGVIVVAGLLPPYPTIESVAPANGQPAATVGVPLELTGHHLDGTGRVVVFSNARFGIDQEAGADKGNASSAEVAVPNLPAGIYRVAVRLVRPGDAEPRTSNELAMALGPEITNFPATVARDGAGTATITLSCQPEIDRDNGFRCSSALWKRQRRRWRRPAAPSRSPSSTRQSVSTSCGCGWTASTAR